MDLADEKNRWMMGLVPSTKFQPSEKLVESRKVLKAVISKIKQQQCRLRMAWAPKLDKVLLRTSTYAEWMGINNSELKNRWVEVVDKGTDVWAEIVGGPAIEGEALDEGEEAEADLYGEVANGIEELVVE